MSFREGTHYAIQARTQSENRLVYVEYTGSKLYGGDIPDSLRRLAKRRTSSNYGDYSSNRRFEPMQERDPSECIRTSENPFQVHTFKTTATSVDVANAIRAIRFYAGQNDIDPSSVCLVTIDVTVNATCPEEGDPLMTELRKLALEKLTESEKSLLSVKHWEVMHKLADRTGLDDDDENEEVPF